MTGADFKQARNAMGMTADQLARIMGYRDKSSIYHIESAETVAPQAARLMLAYLDGYRPGDWNTGVFAVSGA